MGVPGERGEGMQSLPPAPGLDPSSRSRPTYPGKRRHSPSNTLAFEAQQPAASAALPDSLLGVQTHPAAVRPILRWTTSQSGCR
jgi:hypothetical protein